jgi:hypothetical protein
LPIERGRCACSVRRRGWFAIGRRGWRGEKLGRERRAVGRRSFEGTAFRDDHKCVLIYEKQAGEWRIVWEQYSFYEASDQARSHCVIHSRRMTLPKT